MLRMGETVGRGQQSVGGGRRLWTLGAEGVGVCEGAGVEDCEMQQIDADCVCVGV